ncbi:hypothetical protein [Streptomyces sp. NPDC006996]|uniref:hypothetical protein n=1 Tax=Streptomyces sp. NPDC006996 TaxID=3156908 RepID=UPI0033FCF517
MGYVSASHGLKRPAVRLPRRRWLQRLSLRTRLLCLSTALVVVGLLGTGVIVTTALRGYLQDHVDDRLVLTSQVAARVAPPAGIDPSPSVQALSVLGDTTVTYLNDDGAIRRTFDASTVPPGGGPELPALDHTAVLAHEDRPFTVSAKDAEYSWRVIALTQPVQVFPPERAETRGSVVVATSLDEVDRTIAETRNLSLTLGATLLAALTAAGWFAVRSGLPPCLGSRRPRLSSPPATTPTGSSNWPPRTPRWDA